MSDSDSSASTDESQSVIGAIERWYHIPVLFVSMAYMLSIRLMSISNFTVGGQIYFTGTDSYYHLRNVKYTVNNWPSVMPFDPFTYYPFGTHVGQFGTLYDQLLATLALIVGLGNPSEQTIRLVLLVGPALFGTFAAIPTFLIAKRLKGRFAGTVAVVLLALIPGVFLRRTLVGFADHNSAEPFFHAFAILGLIVALQVAEKEVPVFEVIFDRDWEQLKRPIGWGVMGGVAVGLYLWVWPPGFIVIGIFGAALGSWMVTRVWRNKTPEPIAIVSTVSMAVTLVFVLIGFEETAFVPSQLSSLHIVGVLGVALMTLTIAGAARVWESHDLSPNAFVATAVGLAAGGTALVAVVAPSLFNTVFYNTEAILFQFITGSTRTISEAQPITQLASPRYGITATDLLIRQYGLLFHFSLVLFAYTLIVDTDLRGSATRWVFGAWFAVMTLAALSQVRFNYYLAIPIAVTVGYGLDVLRQRQDLTGIGQLLSIDRSTAVGIVIIILVLIPVLLVPIPIGYSSGDTAITTDTSASVASSAAPGGAVQWQGTMQWMQDNTPEEGIYGGADNPMKPYDTYTRPADGDYDYPEGAYGVMAWWDYGHWITVNAERIPYANPFQQGATTAANFLLAPSEEQAATVINETGDESNLRYVAVDWQMVEPRSKFTAPIQFYDTRPTRTADFISPMYVQTQNNIRFGFYMKSQRYYESMMVRLYRFHGSAVQAEPVVVDWETRDSQRGQIRYIPGRGGVTVYDNMSAARKHVRNDGTARIGGIGDHPREDVAALEHYRLVKYSNNSATNSRSFLQSLFIRSQATGLAGDEIYTNTPSWIKTFERVPGATVTGEAPPNTTVVATVEMKSPTVNETFTYKQYAKTGSDGEFTMTLPYSTTGYENWGPDNGYTDVSVTATGPYTFRAVQTNTTTTAPVSEAQVIGEDDSSVTVDLTTNSTDS